MSNNKKPAFIRVLHWSVFVLFVISILSGYRQADKGWPGTGLFDRNIIHLLHETSGILIALLMAVWAVKRARVFWQSRQEGDWWTRAIIVYHAFLASLGGLIAFLGWAGSSAGNYGQFLFGFIPVPNIIPVLSANEAVYLYFYHKSLVPCFLILAALHVGGVLFHVVVLRDRTFQTMWFGSR